MPPEATPSDEATDEFMSLLLQHRHRLYAFIAKLLVNPADVEDVFQTTSIILWKKMDEFDSSRKFFQWACGIAFNEVRNFRTSQTRSKLRFSDKLVDLIAEEAAEESGLADPRLTAMRGCLSNMSARQQEILRRCYMGKQTISEVADSLGRERTALYKQLARLKRKLLECVRLRVAGDGAAS